MRKIISILLFICAMSVCTTVGAAYKDVPEKHWGAKTAEWAVKNGYMAAYDGYFSPNKAIPRIDAIVALAAMKGIKDTPSSEQLSFKDFSQAHKGYGVIVQLVKLGIIEERQYFNPNEPMTRAQMSKILALLFDIQVDMKNDAKFSDVPAALWASTYIESLADIQIINASQQRFYPHRAVTKIQLAAFMERITAFQQQVTNNEVIYDYLQKKYIYTFQHYSEWVHSVIDLVNVEREKHGLKSLALDDKLSQLAIIKVKDLIENNYFEHKSPTYGHIWDQGSLFNYRFSILAENLARNYSSPEAVMAGWMKSETHRTKILSNKYTHMGLGVQQKKDGSYYWVQVFSKK